MQSLAVWWVGQPLHILYVALADLMLWWPLLLLVSAFALASCLRRRAS